ncbi:MAG: hypothetical protein JOZ41_09585, partial [Chloroflexi bacterium]|nr:hypothetical protein [Chloroflexota bacterium]
ARCTPQVCEFGLTSPLLLDRPSAAKTGTTNAWTDNWTVGYTPQIISGVWVGNADRSPMRHVIGVTGAAPIWHDFMERAFKLLKLPKIWYVAPGSVVTTNRCTLPGSRAVSYGAADITLATSPPPLCALPERGFMPLKCPPARLLPNLQCAATPYTYTYGYGSQNQPYTYYSQSGSAQPNAFGSPSPQGNVPASP